MAVPDAKFISWMMPTITSENNYNMPFVTDDRKKTKLKKKKK
jgi:hypothetical protein